MNNIYNPNENSVKNVVFFFPFREISGGPFFLSNLAKKLVEHTDSFVAYVDYKDGLARKILEKSNVVFLDYNDERSYEIYPDREILLVMPVYLADVIPLMKLNNNSKILFLNWHNLCIPLLRSRIRCNNEILKPILKTISENNAEFYCDKAHWAAQEEFGISFKEKYVPITLPERVKRASSQVIDQAIINISVLGRLVVDKVYAITDLIDNLKKDISKDCPINIFIIGDGDYSQYLKEYHRSKNIKLHFMGTLSIEKIDDLLTTKVDILFSMGTSALEGAAIGLPTVIIPNDTKPFRCNRYAYLHECNNYLLGWGPDQIDAFEITTHTVGEIIKDIYTENRKSEIGSLCRRYYLEYHYDNSELFKHAMEGTSLLYEQFKKDIEYVIFLTKENRDAYIKDMMKHINDRMLAIWGMGSGGRKLLKDLKNLGIYPDVIVDAKADNIKEVNGIPVQKPDILSPDKHMVFVSLLGFNKEIDQDLKKWGFIRNYDYLYVYCPLDE